MTQSRAEQSRAEQSRAEQSNLCGCVSRAGYLADGDGAYCVCDTVKVPTVIDQNSPSHRGNFPIKSGTP